MKLYKKKFYLPINKKDKRKGSAILLLSPSYEMSNFLMNNEFIVNRNKAMIIAGKKDGRVADRGDFFYAVHYRIKPVFYHDDYFYIVFVSVF